MSVSAAMSSCVVIKLNASLDVVDCSHPPIAASFDSEQSNSWIGRKTAPDTATCGEITADGSIATGQISPSQAPLEAVSVAAAVVIAGSTTGKAS
jgi:hypothetical protein